MLFYRYGRNYSISFSNCKEIVTKNLQNLTINSLKYFLMKNHNIIFFSKTDFDNFDDFGVEEI